jgi:integrase
MHAPRRPGAKRSRPPIILLACFCGLRWSELVALRRRDVDTSTATVRITRQLTEVNGQAPLFSPPKLLPAGASSSSPRRSCPPSRTT